MTSPWFYSALYNGSYMVLDCALVLLVGWILWKPMGKYIRGDDIKASCAATAKTANKNYFWQNPGRKARVWFTFRAGIAILASVDKERESRNDHL